MFGPGALVGEDELRKEFHSVGKGVKVFEGCRIDGRERVSIGDCSQIDEGVWILPAKA